MIAASSGSTGEPTFWPRSLIDELAVSARFEQVFRDSFAADTRRTLAVVCFPLGTWVGGMFTASCCRHLATKGYPITVARNRQLTIAVELAPGAAPGTDFNARVADAVLAVLLRLSSEFANYVPQERRLPLVTLWPAGHPEYFPPGVKHRYASR